MPRILDAPWEWRSERIEEGPGLILELVGSLLQAGEPGVASVQRPNVRDAERPCDLLVICTHSWGHIDHGTVWT